MPMMVAPARTRGYGLRLGVGSAGLAGTFCTLSANMPNEDILNLEHDVERHEGDLDQLADRITTLEHDLRLIV